MKLKELTQLKTELSAFVEYFRKELGRSERRHWCKMYLSGLMLEGKRKSIEPMSARLPGGDEQSLQQFVNQSPWDEQTLQRTLVGYLNKKLKPTKGILVFDDTSFPKKGNHSVGVARQYCGALGKVSNCQSMVSIQYAYAQAHFPLCAQLYLPKSWTEHRERMELLGVPKDKQAFQQKWKIALSLLDEYASNFPSYEAVVCDAGYGEIRPFLSQLDKREVTFVAQIPQSHAFWPVSIGLKRTSSATGRPRKYPEVANKKHRPLSAYQYKEKLLVQKEHWKTLTLALQKKKKVRATALRVREVNSTAYWRPGPERWLIIEELSDGTFRYHVSNADSRTSLKRMLHWAHQRWTIEQGYQQLKQELGLDHFEGRSWRGLHHHVTLCFMAFAFLLLIRKKKPIP